MRFLVLVYISGRCHSSPLLAGRGATSPLGGGRPSAWASLLVSAAARPSAPASARVSAGGASSTLSCIPEVYLVRGVGVRFGVRDRVHKGGRELRVTRRTNRGESRKFRAVVVRNYRY